MAAGVPVRETARWPRRDRRGPRTRHNFVRRGDLRSPVGARVGNGAPGGHRPPLHKRHRFVCRGGYHPPARPGAGNGTPGGSGTRPYADGMISSVGATCGRPLVPVWETVRRAATGRPYNISTLQSLISAQSACSMASMTIFMALMRAKRLSTDSSTCQGAKVVLVRASISLMAVS